MPLSRDEIIEAGARLYLEKYGFDSYRKAITHAEQVVDGAISFGFHVGNDPIEEKDVEDFFVEMDIQYWEE